MVKYKVTGRAINRITRQPIGRVRTEIIDTERNVLFKGAENTLDVEMMYESFWNDLNPNSKEIVKVIGVKRMDKIKKDNYNNFGGVF